MNTFDLIGAEPAGFGDNMVAAFQAAQAAQSPSLDAVRGGDATLETGTKGEAVKYVQGKLGLPQDSDFGPKTEAAVKSFQKAHSLPQTGTVDATTIAILDSGAYVIHETAPGKPAATGVSAVVEAPSKASTYLGYALAALAALGVGVAVVKS